MAQVSDYTSLITSEHADKPKFISVVGVVAGCFVDLQNFLISLPTEFDISSAWGHRQDVIGQLVGLDRNLKPTAPGMYSPPPPSGVVPLADNDYQILLRGKVGANIWDGSMEGAFDHLTGMFGDTGSRLFMIDNQDMSMIIAVAGNVPSAAFKAALSGGYMQIRPAGVRASFAYPSGPGGPLFGLDIENEFIAGLDEGVWYLTE